MPLFRYEALDRTGKKVVGAMDVADEHALTSRLSGMGYRPVAVIPAPQRGLQTAARSQTGHGTTLFSGNANPATTEPVSRLTASERSLARTFHQLHIALKAGMPLYSALTTVTNQVPEASMRQVLTEMGAGVRDGKILSSLMAHYPRLFSPGDLGMIRAAEMAGFLPEAFGTLAAQHEQDDNTQRRLKVWQWFFHSNVATLFLFIPAALCLKDMIGALAGNATDPVAVGVRTAGWASLWITLPLLLGYFGALIAFGQLRKDPRFLFGWHRFLLRVPVVNRINYLRANAAFARVLQQLYHAGIAAGTAWQTAAAAVPNRFLAARFGAHHGTVAATGRFSDAMQQTGLLDPADVGMVATGEVAGEIAQALDYLAGRYEEDVRVGLGSLVVRGAVTFTFWAFALGAIAMAFFAWCYGQGLMKLGSME